MAATETEARAQFESLVELAAQGEEVVIRRDDGRCVELVQIEKSSHAQFCGCPICGESISG